jgi:hypothetical protein
MKWLGFLNLRGISGQIAALVVASIVAIHLILTASFLVHRPDQIDPSVDRGHGQLAAAVQLLGATSRASHLIPLLSPTTPMVPICDRCIAASAAATGCFHSRRSRTSAGSALRCPMAR